LKEAFFAPGNDPRVWLNGWHPETHEAEGHARNTTPVDDYFAAGTAPMLDLHGENDAVAPCRFSQVLKNMLGDRVTVVILLNAGHAMAPEQPKAMADAVSTFATRQSITVPSMLKLRSGVPSSLRRLSILNTFSVVI
jgi:pimeloyl-ACP methyl ester carboxylesterase